MISIGVSGHICSELINFIASMAPSDELPNTIKPLPIYNQLLQTHESKKKENKQDIQILK